MDGMNEKWTKNWMKYISEQPPIGHWCENVVNSLRSLSEWVDGNDLRTSAINMQTHVHFGSSHDIAVALSTEISTQKTVQYAHIEKTFKSYDPFYGNVKIQ